jgi:hypothetical protein
VALIASVHLAEVGRGDALRLMRMRLRRGEVSGLRYARITTLAPLGAGLLPRPRLRGVGLMAVWEQEGALEDFLANHRLAAELTGGWHVRLQPTHVFGLLPAVPELAQEGLAMEDGEPSAVLTVGRLRLSQTVRFLRASAAAEGLAVRDPALLAATGMARPPGLVATFSLWRTVAAMRAYAQGQREPEHRAASRAHAAKPFHHHSAFIRFRPYASEGQWNGVDPLADLAPGSLPAEQGLPGS